MDPHPAAGRGWPDWRRPPRDQLDTWQDYRVDVDEYRELDADRVLVPYHRSGRGKASGLEIGQLQSRGASLFHVRDGKVTRLVFYLDHRRALADLGLASEGDASEPGSQ